ncbi:hypothetical protein [Streptomyces albidoflavus]|uniref:hypothetical protein n=1 Tax=Streptomyces albidoflavus TaxID=1886 RepID=UPI003977CA38
MLRSSAAPEGDRHEDGDGGCPVVGGVAILGRPGGRPPRLIVREASITVTSLRSSAAPKGDRHSGTYQLNRHTRGR